MEEIELLKARFKELSFRSISQAHLCNSEFLSLSEQNIFYAYQKENDTYHNPHILNGSHFLLYGGYEASDRKAVFFLPEYLTEEEFFLQEKEHPMISCLHIFPKNPKFADKLTHRDFLGALMNTGYERKYFGDILTDSLQGYVYLLSSIAQDVASLITKVKHTTMECKIIQVDECPFKQEFIEKTIFIASERIDSIIGEVFNLSRRSSQELIGSQSVFVDGLVIMNNSYRIKPNQRVSVRGSGKFIYLSEARATKRGRLSAKVKIFK
ncbi:MAG: YlmH/Sll1252 family protein [Bacilli bacterium]